MAQPESHDRTSDIKEKVARRDPYEVLEIQRDATLDQVKSSYRRLALKYHPDKNTEDPKASEKFHEIAFSYGILSDKEKRHMYDVKGFDSLDLAEIEDSLDLSSLGVVNTALVAFFSKLGVPIRTSVSATVLKEALDGTAVIRPLPVGRPLFGRVEKQQAHFYCCTLTEEQSKQGFCIRVASNHDCKFKLLYFDEDEMGSLNLRMKESSTQNGKKSTAGFYFFGFRVFSLDPTVSAMESARDPHAVLFRKLDSWTPAELFELKHGTHTFAVYGDNFFNNTPYTIEASVVDPASESCEKLREIEAKIEEKRQQIREFETDYRQILARYIEAEKRLKEEKSEVDELVSARNRIHESFSSGVKPLNSVEIGLNFPKNDVTKLETPVPRSPHIFPSLTPRVPGQPEEIYNKANGKAPAKSWWH